MATTKRGEKVCIVGDDFYWWVRVKESKRKASASIRLSWAFVASRMEEKGRYI